eukprot:TRINITY_DN15081_c0_g1_i1.p1 TRINITY_DN15081_c0_g1~~TRINITY_DN15081_c0_g1_i1.p1  ORF type:complete len:153 (-),score=38.21 TRINITY_DN15081_c0_g1_i1:98-556(-)
MFRGVIRSPSSLCRIPLTPPRSKFTLSLYTTDTPVSNPVDKPAIGRKIPYFVNLEKGKTYSWCSCGLSSKQPFCDGSHVHAKGLKPLKFEVQESKKYLLCGCKQTKNKPYCDLTHIKVIGKSFFGGNDEKSMTEQRKAEILSLINEKQTNKT